MAPSKLSWRRVPPYLCISPQIHLQNVYVFSCCIHKCSRRRMESRRRSQKLMIHMRCWFPASKFPASKQAPHEVCAWRYFPSVTHQSNTTETSHKHWLTSVAGMIYKSRTPTKMQAYTHYTQVRSAKTKPCASANAHIHQQRIQTMKWTIVQASKRHSVETNTVSDLLIELSHI